MRYIIALACMMTVGFTGIKAETTGSSAPAAADMKIMSYNIRSSSMPDKGVNSWESRRQPSLDMIKDENPDLIGLQEAHGNQREALVEGLGDIYELHCAGNYGVADKESGNTAMMWRKDRFTVKDKGIFWLSPTPDELSKPEWGATDRHYRTSVWALLHDNKENRDVLMCDTHLPYKMADRDARDACIQLIIGRMQQKATDDMVVVITGDMNASWHANDSRRDCLRHFYKWMGSAREDAPVNLNPTTYSFNCFGQKTPAETWNIDHIFYRNLTPLEFNVVDSDKYGVQFVSDHFPITLTVKY